MLSDITKLCFILQGRHAITVLAYKDKRHPQVVFCLQKPSSSELWCTKTPWCYVYIYILRQFFSCQRRHVVRAVDFKDAMSSDVVRQFFKQVHDVSH